MPPGAVSPHRLKRGLDLPLAGVPEQVVHPAAPVERVALLGADPVGLKPAFHVQPGDRVQRGQLLFEDKKIPGVRHTAPAAGTVLALHRGERRAFQSLVIEVEDDPDDDQQVALASFHGAAPDSLSADAVRALLLESGLWTALRMRPFSRVADPADKPQALFVTAMDTRPHAPSVEVLLDASTAVMVTTLLPTGNALPLGCE